MPDNRTDDWLMEEWRRISIPDWARILAESKENWDTRRWKYAEALLMELREER